MMCTDFDLHQDVYILFERAAEESAEMLVPVFLWCLCIQLFRNL